MHRFLVAAFFAGLCAPAFADTPDVSPEMKCAPDDNACIERARPSTKTQKGASRAGEKKAISPVGMETEPCRPMAECGPGMHHVGMERADHDRWEREHRAAMNAPERIDTLHKSGFYIEVHHVGDEIRSVAAHEEKSVEQAAKEVKGPVTSEKTSIQRAANETVIEAREDLGWLGDQVDRYVDWDLRSHSVK